MCEEQRSLSRLPFKGASKTEREIFYRGNSSWGQGVLGEGVGKGRGAVPGGEQRAGACWGEVWLGEGWCWLLLRIAVLCKHQGERGSGVLREKTRLGERGGSPGVSRGQQGPAWCSLPQPMECCSHPTWEERGFVTFGG